MSLPPGRQLDQPGRRADALADGRSGREHLAPDAGTHLGKAGSWHACLPGCASLGSGAGPVLHLGELALAEAGPLTHRGVASVLR